MKTVTRRIAILAARAARSPHVWSTGWKNRLRSAGFDPQLVVDAEASILLVTNPDWAARRREFPVPLKAESAKCGWCGRHHAY